MSVVPIFCYSVIRYSINNFCPVGTAFSSDYIEISDVYNGSVKANDLTKDEILHTANAYSNHGGEIIYRVSYHRVTEDWNK